MQNKKTDGAKYEDIRNSEEVHGFLESEVHDLALYNGTQKTFLDSDR